MNIYLIGFMGAGKSTVGSLLADVLEYEFIDTDSLIEDEECMTINDIFKKKGERYFRDRECEVINRLSQMNNVIVSCGGGIIKNDNNIRLMKESGRVILLEVTPEVIYNRVKDSDNRPLLRNRKNIADITKLLEERMPLYDLACTDRVNAEGEANEVASTIKRILNL